MNGFFTSVSSNDRDSLAIYFPGFAKIDAAQQEAYLSVFLKVSGWEIEDITIDETSAVASVKVTMNTGDFFLHLPLTRLENRWVVTERTSIRTDLGTVEAD